ncbi:MAG: RNA-binding S4 domain-containing protein [Thiobacillus sp.]
MPTDQAMPDTGRAGKMRLDKWLWAARFFKTRSLASQAIEQGRVKLAGERVKPAREIGPGDRLDLLVGDADWTVTVRALSMQRGPAPVAQALYEEDPASHARRQQQASERKLAASPAAAIKGRPTKRDRRLIHRFTDE